MELTEEWARSLVESAGHSVYVTDREGTIQYVNPAFEEMTGYSREEALGQKPSLLKSGKHSEEFYENLWETILSGKTWHSEILNRRKNGELYYVDQTISPIDNDEDEIEGFVAINVDITERKNKRNFIEQLYSRLEEEQQIISQELHDKIGHDLLFALLKLRNQRNENIRPERKETLTNVIHKLENCINEIRDLSSLLRPPSKERGDLRELLETHAEKISEQHDVNIEVEMIHHDEVIDDLDSRIQQVLYRVAQEAVMNAVEHGGADEISLLVQLWKQRVSLLVEDNGAGFRTERLKELSLRDKIGIVGMRERVEVVDGSFKLESEPGAGTRLKIDVPRSGVDVSTDPSFNASNKQSAE